MLVEARCKKKRAWLELGGGRVKDVGRIKIRGHADSDILSVLFQFSFVLRYEPCFRVKHSSFYLRENRSLLSLIFVKFLR